MSFEERPKQIIIWSQQYLHGLSTKVGCDKGHFNIGSNIHIQMGQGQKFCPNPVTTVMFALILHWTYFSYYNEESVTKKLEYPGLGKFFHQKWGEKFTPLLAQKLTPEPGSKTYCRVATLLSGWLYVGCGTVEWHLYTNIQAISI